MQEAENSQEAKDKEEKFEVTEESFHAAVNNASYWARVRLFKKMNKVVHRAARFLLSSTTRKAGVYTQPMPPADLEAYVKNFVLLNKDKREKA